MSPPGYISKDVTTWLQTQFQPQGGVGVGVIDIPNQPLFFEAGISSNILVVTSR